MSLGTVCTGPCSGWLGTKVHSQRGMAHPGLWARESPSKSAPVRWGRAQGDTWQPGGLSWVPWEGARGTESKEPGPKDQGSPVACAQSRLQTLECFPSGTQPQLLFAEGERLV